MRLSLSLSGIGPLEPTFSSVDAAEANGFDGIWSCEQIGFHDAVVPSAAYALRTGRLEIGLMGLSAATRHPGMTATEIASLAELAPGRLRVAVGTGDPGLIAKLGQRVRAPVRRTSQLVRALREALAGQPLSGDFDAFSFHGFQLAAPTHPPAIDVMAVRPRMLALAASDADGVALSMGSSLLYLRETVSLLESELREAGRIREEFRISATCMMAIEEDLDGARNIVRTIISMAEPEMVEYLARGVLASGQLSANGLGASLTDEVVDALAMVTMPEGLAEQLERYQATGIDELVVFLLAPAESQPARIEQLAAAARR